MSLTATRLHALIQKLLSEGREDLITTQNDVSLAGRWWFKIECWLGSLVNFQGIWTSITKEPYSFVIFQWGGGGSVPPLDPRMGYNQTSHMFYFGLYKENHEKIFLSETIRPRVLIFGL